MSDKTFVLFFMLYLILSPFYIIDSGYPQPADFLLLVGIGFGFLHFLQSKEFKINQAYFIGFVFAIHTLIINMTHYIYYPDIRFLLTSLIYIFNVAAFTFTCFLVKKYPRTIIKIIFYIVALSICWQFYDVIFRPSDHPFRATGTFNNPNQLAYWVLISAAILFIIKYNTKLIMVDYGLFGMLLYIEMLSLSKAGIITLSLLYLIGFLNDIRKQKGSNLILILFLVASIGIAITLSNSALKFDNNSAIEKAISRIASIGDERDDSLDGRGYTRITENPVYLIIGAGEGAFWRHEGGGHNQELHSGLATLLFGYGIIGFLLFGFFIFSILKHRPLFFCSIFFIVMMFGLTHQNLRFSLFWVFLALTYVFPIITYKNKKENLINE